MPDKITFDDALQSSPQSIALATGRITFDDAMATRIAGAQRVQPGPGGAPMVPPGTEIVPGAGLPGAPGFTPPMLMQRPAPATESNLGVSLKTAIAADDQTKLRLIAGALFPNDPNGVKRVGLAEGRPVFVNDQGQLQLVSGPWSRMFGNVVASTPEVAGAVLGSLAEGQPITGAATGAAGGRALKRGLSQLLFDEPVSDARTVSIPTVFPMPPGMSIPVRSPSGSVAKEMAAEAGVTALGGNAGKLIAGMANRGRIVDYTPAQMKTAEQSRAFVKQRTGIDLDLAQASGDRMLLGLRDYAAKYPGRTAEIIQARDEITTGQLDAATNRVLGMVSNARPAEVAGKDAINAAQAVISTARGSVYEQVRPLYDAAYAAVPEITDQRILGYFKLPYFEQAFKKGQKIAKLEGTALQPNAAPDLRSLDYTKRALDDNIEQLKSAGKRQEARALQIKRDEFVDAIDALPNQQWQAARQAYAQGIASTVTPLEDGLIGVLAKMHPKNAQTAARIFNDPSITPEQIAILKGGLMRSNPDAYRGLVRQWLAQKYNMSMRETQGADVINPAGKFRQAVIGTPSQKANARAILPADAADAFDDLMLAAEKLARTPLGASRIAGSPTASNQLVTDALRGRALSNLKWLLAPRESLKGEAERRAQEQGVTALTEALLDPAKRGQLKMIARMKPSQRQLLLLAPMLTVNTGLDVAAAQGMAGESVTPDVYRAMPR